ncbi:MAG: ECF transporter S component [Bifidobacterium aquikefiri]|uniref:ECF-type riboflavin transporter, S component n=2 Tax=Bifidobacterium TaxID=1678 RepID=A0A261GBK7_9BIFI|nr:ECF transporter S component [Bifidobacterium aquikefiri]OZG68784.1 ECF-type riboflavin transporter, S component [Bifidobacterium aquikefiri]
MSSHIAQESTAHTDIDSANDLEEQTNNPHPTPAQHIRTISLVFLGLLGICLILLLVQSVFRMDTAYAFAIIIVPVIAAVALWIIEKQKLDTVTLAITAALAALAVVSRIVKIPIPDVELTSFLVILAGLSLGPESGFLTGALNALISNAWLGQGAWTPWQMLAWGIMGAAAGWIRGYRWSQNRIVMFVWGIVWAFIFGWILDIWSWLTYIRVYTVPAFFASLASSAPFDMMNAISTGVLLLITTPWAVNLIRRAQDDNTVSPETSDAHVVQEPYE